MRKPRGTYRSSAQPRATAHDTGDRPRQPRSSPAGRPPDDVTSVRLTRKLAEVIDGVDLKHANVGDKLDLSRHDADVLIAEGWAEPSARQRETGAPEEEET